MKLQFKNQKFQSDAAKAVTDSFIGQRNATMQEYTMDMGSDNQASFFDVVGFSNAPLNTDIIQLTKNVCEVRIAHILRGRDKRLAVRITVA